MIREKISISRDFYHGGDNANILYFNEVDPD